MKMIKKIAALTVAAFTAFNAFAADELYNATAGAVNNNSSYLLDVIDWKKMDFPQAYGLVSLSSEYSGNLGGAYKLNNGGVIHGYWNGNLWAENAYNTFSALYGKDNMAFAGSFSKADESYFGASAAVKLVSGQFGMHINDKMAFAAGLGYGWADVNDADLSVFNVNGEFVYNLEGTSGSSSSSKTRSRGKAKAEEPKPAAKSSNGKESRAGVLLGFTNVSVSDADLSGSVTVLSPFYELQMPLASTVKYGFKFTMPFTCYGGDFSDNIDNSVSFTLQNGFTAQIKPTVVFAAGIETELPTIYFGDTDNGNFRNTFYLGCGIDVASNIQLAVCANIKPTDDDDSGSNGESLNEIWEQSFAISISVKL